MNEQIAKLTSLVEQQQKQIEVLTINISEIQAANLNVRLTTRCTECGKLVHPGQTACSEGRWGMH